MHTVRTSGWWGEGGIEGRGEGGEGLARKAKQSMRAIHAMTLDGDKVGLLGWPPKKCNLLVPKKKRGAQDFSCTPLSITRQSSRSPRVPLLACL